MDYQILFSIDHCSSITVKVEAFLKKKRFTQKDLNVTLFLTTSSSTGLIETYLPINISGFELIDIYRSLNSHW